MKRIITIIVAILSIALFTSCAKKTDEVEKNYTIKEINGLKVYANKNVPSVKDLKVAWKQPFGELVQVGISSLIANFLPSKADLRHFVANFFPDTQK